MKKLLMASAILGSTFVVPSVSAATYIYTGNNFNSFIGNSYDASDSVSGFFKTEAALGADLDFMSISDLITEFSFSDGRRTLTNFDPAGRRVSVSTDAFGNINDWRIEITRRRDRDGDFSDVISTRSDSFATVDSGFVRRNRGLPGIPRTLGSVRDNAGTWAIQINSPVPEPATWAFMIVGFGAIGGALRSKGRRQRKADVKVSYT